MRASECDYEYAWRQHMAAGAPGLEVCPEKLRSAVAPRYSLLIGERERGEKQQGGVRPRTLDVETPPL